MLIDEQYRHSYCTRCYEPLPAEIDALRKPASIENLAKEPVQADFLANASGFDIAAGVLIVAAVIFGVAGLIMVYTTSRIVGGDAYNILIAAGRRVALIACGILVAVIACTFAAFGLGKFDPG